MVDCCGQGLATTSELFSGYLVLITSLSTNFCQHDDCDQVIGENEARISTVDMLRHIELRMETLTQEQEILNQNKVFGIWDNF